jgi:hypothetical protein
VPPLRIDPRAVEIVDTMDLPLSPSTLALAVLAVGGWLFALACFIGFHRSRKSEAHTYLALSRPANVVDIEDLRARHERLYRRRRAA